MTCLNCSKPAPGRYCSDCEYMTLREARERLHISVPTLYRWVKLRKIKPRKVGPRKQLVSRAEIDALLQAV